MAVKNNRKGDSAMETKSFSKLPYAVMLVMVVTLGLGSEAFGQTSKSDQKPTQVVKTVFTSSDVQPVLIKKTSKTTK